MSMKVNKNGKGYPVGVIPQSLYDDVEDLKDAVFKGSVSVTADGNKTYTTLLNELFSNVDMSKIGDSTKYIDESSSSANYSILTQKTSSQLRFNKLIGNVAEEAIVSGTSSYYHYVFDGSTPPADWSGAKPSAGHKLIIKY